MGASINYVVKQVGGASDFTTFDNDRGGGGLLKTTSAEHRNSLSGDMPINETMFIFLLKF